MCTSACIEFAHRVLTPEIVRGRRVLEVGSYDTTGTVRPGIEALGPASYLGVDIEPGPSVDELCNVYDLESRYGRAAFDLVITTEMVEHVRDWRRAFANLKAVLAPGGVLLVTTRSLGFPYHFGPFDYWRYELEDMRAIAAEMDIVALESDPVAPGVFLAARKTTEAVSDLASIALHSMVKGRRVATLTDRDVTLFEWTNPRLVGHRLPAPARRAIKRVYRAATGTDPGDGIATSGAASRVPGHPAAESPGDIATREHWDQEHSRATDVPDYSDLVPDRHLVEYIRTHLQPQAGERLLEVGAGNSAYLPLLARTFGYSVCGLDYSPLGVQLAERNLAHFGVPGEVRECDLFATPDDWRGAFDVVVSFGVVEHFENIDEVLAACARYLRPGGRMLTLVPNMHGLPGAAQRFISEDLFRRHVAYRPNQLANAHRRIGLRILDARYEVGLNFWVVNPSIAGPVRRLLFSPLLVLTKLGWALETRNWFEIKPNRWSSPWVIVLAEAAIDRQPET